MTIVCAMLTLDYAGVPTYVLTLSREMARRGHRVVVYCPTANGGRPLASMLEVVDDVSDLAAPDVIFVHHRSLAPAVRSRFSNVPLVFIAHGIFSPESVPPAVRVDRYVAINEQVVGQLTADGIRREDIDLVRDFVDTDRFASTAPLRAKPRVLFLSNYKKWNNYFFAFDACGALGLDFRAVGVPYGRSPEIERNINAADLVLSWGRGVLEAMACGRAVISYDQAKMRPTDLYTTVTGDGYLDDAGYFESRERNFGPVGCRYVFISAAQVVEQIKRYRPEDGVRNHCLALEHHDHRAGVDALLASVEKARASCS